MERWSMERTKVWPWDNVTDGVLWLGLTVGFNGTTWWTRPSWPIRTPRSTRTQWIVAARRTSKSYVQSKHPLQVGGTTLWNHTLLQDKDNRYRAVRNNQASVKVTFTGVAFIAAHTSLAVMWMGIYCAWGFAKPHRWHSLVWVWFTPSVNAS